MQIVENEQNKENHIKYIMKKNFENRKNEIKNTRKLRK